MTVAEQLGQELIGTVGRVTVPIDAVHQGEVVIPVRGGTEAYAACADEHIAKNSRVVVVELLSGRTVLVTPCS